MRVLGLTASSVVGFDPSYELIQTVFPSGSTSITFDNLQEYSSSYDSLQIRSTARTNNASATGLINVTVNNDTSTNYSWIRLRGQNSSVSEFGSFSANSMRMGFATGSASEAGSFSATVIDIYDPYSLSNKTTFRYICGLTGAGTGTNVEFGGGAHDLLSAVSSIKLTPVGSFESGSRFSIYGIRR